MDYLTIIRPLPREEGGGFLAELPDLPGCISDGESCEEAIANVRDAAEEWIATAKEMGRTIPEPDAVEGYSGKWLQRVPKSLHMRLTVQAKREGVGLNALATALLAEGLGKRNAAA